MQLTDHGPGWIHGHHVRDRCDTCRDWPDWAAEIIARFDELETTMTDFANDQAHLDADVQAIGGQFATVIAELKAQHEAGQPLDFTAADALVQTVTAEASTDAPPADNGDASGDDGPADTAPVDSSTPTA